MRDLAALNRWIDDFERKQSRMYAAADLESASITNGRLRFIGGLLRVDSGGRVEIVGTLQIDGITTVRGEFNVEGPWNLTGDGTISGDVSITGKVTQVGDMDVEGVFTLNGDGWSITGDGMITGKVGLTGEIRVEQGGRVIVTGPDGDTILAASKMTFANGAALDANGGTGVALRAGTYTVVAAAGVASLGTTGRRFEVDGFYAGPRAVGMATIPRALRPDNKVGDVIADPDGVFYRVVEI